MHLDSTVNAHAAEGRSDSPAVDIAEACELLGVSRPTIYALVKRGELTLFKVGRCSRLNRRQVLALVGEGDDHAA